jgi:hypothetical protein
MNAKADVKCIKCGTNIGWEYKSLLRPENYCDLCLVALIKERRTTTHDPRNPIRLTEKSGRVE